MIKAETLLEKIEKVRQQKMEKVRQLRDEIEELQEQLDVQEIEVLKREIKIRTWYRVDIPGERTPWAYVVKTRKCQDCLRIYYYQIRHIRFCHNREQQSVVIQYREPEDTKGNIIGIPEEGLGGILIEKLKHDVSLNEWRDNWSEIGGRLNLLMEFNLSDQEVIREAEEGGGEYVVEDGKLQMVIGMVHHDIDYWYE